MHIKRVTILHLLKKSEKYMIIATIVIPVIFGTLLFSNTDIDFEKQNIKQTEIQQVKVSASNYEYEQIIGDLKDVNDSLSAEIQQLRSQLETQPQIKQSTNTDLIQQLESENDRMSAENRKLEKEISKLSSDKSNKQDKPPQKSEIKKLEDKISQLEKDLKNEKSKKKYLFQL